MLNETWSTFLILIFDHKAAKIPFCLWYTAGLAHEGLTVGGHVSFSSLL